MVYNRTYNGMLVSMLLWGNYCFGMPNNACTGEFCLPCMSFIIYLLTFRNTYFSAFYLGMLGGLSLAASGMNLLVVSISLSVNHIDFSAYSVFRL